MFQINVIFEQEYLEKARRKGILPMLELKDAAHEAFGREGTVEDHIFRVIAKGDEPELRSWAYDVCRELDTEMDDYYVEIIPYDPMGGIRGELNELIGAEEFKELAEELMAVAPQIERFSIKDVFMAQNYLFALNEGCGLSTYLRIFSKLLSELGLFAGVEEVTEYKLEAPEYTGDVAPLNRCLDKIKKHEPGVICMDLTEWMNQITEPGFKAFLQKLNLHQREYIYVFRIPFLEQDAMMKVKLGLNDLMLARLVPFTPFTKEDYGEYLTRMVEGYGFTLEENTWPVIEDKINEEKKDGYFYGFKTIQKIVHELMYSKICCNMRNHTEEDTVIDIEDIRQILIDDMEQDKTGLEMLLEMEGLDTLKAWVKEMIGLAEYRSNGQLSELPSLHVQFVGNPGTGKTTVARIIGRIFREHHLLANGSFLEVSGRDLCGKCVGETAPKTMAICRDAHGSVLFIDEAYSLCQGNKDQGDYGHEALVTLMTEMENHRNDMMVILSGYADEMDQLVSMNPGVKNRIPRRIVFKNYTREELYRGFMRLVRKQFQTEPEFEDRARAFFNGISEECYQARDFGNMRLVRNLYERVFTKAMMRKRFAEDEAWIVTAEDFSAAAAEADFRELLEGEVQV